MRVCSSDVSVVLVALVGLAAFVVAAASHGGVFYVGDQDGWVGNPAESYGRWAARHRFKVTDTLGTQMCLSFVTTHPCEVSL